MKTMRAGSVTTSISKRRLIPVALMVFSGWLGEWSFIASVIRSILHYSRSGLIAYPIATLETDEVFNGIYWRVAFFREAPNLEIIGQSGFGFVFLAFWAWCFYQFLKSVTTSISKRRLIPVALMVFSGWLGEWSFIASVIRSILHYSRSGLIAYPIATLETDEVFNGIYWRVAFFREAPNLEIIGQSGFGFVFLAFWAWCFYQFLKYQRIERLDDHILKISKLSVMVQNETLLDNVCFKLKRGKCLAIAGPNGAGKSTLFRALLNLVPYTGQIEWSGKTKLGFVPQKLSERDIPISVKEFLSIKSTSNIDSSLSVVGLDNKILGKTLGVLSGGQMQRVLIAWAIIDKPNVLLLDEPTTGIDLDSEESILKMLNELKQKNNVTILLVTHDLHIIRDYSDYLLALNKCVTYFGESKDIVNTPEVQNMIYRNGLHARREID